MKTHKLLIALILVAAWNSTTYAQPTVTRQPTNQSVSLGATASFQVTATTTNPPLSFQWRFKEMELGGQTTRLVSLTNIQANNGGGYDVVVADLSGSVTSQVATLTVDTTFTKITTGSIVTDLNDYWNGSWGDYDNDGYLDMFVTTQAYGVKLAEKYLYHNNGDGTFTRIMEGSPVNDLGNCPGACWVDYDNDGFLDLFVSNGAFWAQIHGGLLTNFLYHNNGNSNNWLAMKLVGTVSNRSAIGTKVRVQATIRGKTMWLVRQIFGGDSGSNEQPLDAHFGLGGATNVDLVRIEWPSGIVQTLTNVAARQFLTVVEHQEPGRASVNFTSVSRSTDGAVDLSVGGDTGLRYRFEASTNLLNWTWLGVRTNLNGTVVFEDSRATNFSRRFYRAAAP